jgi:transcriptional regulator with XRE-family HTH domain
MEAHMAGPTIRRRQLGRRLRSIREAANQTPKEAAKWIRVTESTLSRVETGKVAPKLAHIRGLCQLYGIESPDSDALLRMAREANQTGWWVAYGDTVPNWFRDYIGLEGDTSELHTYDPELIHGLLQTPDYVRAVRLAAQPHAMPGDLERSVELRQARQDNITKTKPPKLTAVMSEGALRRLVGGPEVMRGQLQHLLEMSELGHVDIRVLSFEAGAHPAMISPFTILHFPGDDEDDDMAAVYLENDLGGLVQERPRDIERYEWIFQQVKKAALPRKQSRQLIATLMEHL